MTQAAAVLKVKVYVDSIRIEQVEKLPIPKGKEGKIPVSNQDSNGGTDTIPGRYDPGDTEMSGIWANLTGILYLQTSQRDRKLHNFEIDWEDGSITTFQAYLGLFNVEDDNERMIYRQVVSVQGIPLTTQSRTALTTPFLAFKDQSDAAITSIIPAASATVGKRVLDVVTGTTGIKVTATCATANTAIYLGTYNSSGILSETTLTTGTASSLITLNGAGSLTEIYVRVSETGKADAFYPITVARA